MQASPIELWQCTLLLTCKIPCYSSAEPPGQRENHINLSLWWHWLHDENQLPIRTKITESLCNWPEQHLKFHFERNKLLLALNKTSLLIHFKNEDRCSSANSIGRVPQGQDKGNWDAFIKYQIAQMWKVSFSEIWASLQKRISKILPHVRYYTYSRGIF